MSARDDFRLRQFEKRLGTLEASVVDAHQRVARLFMPGKVAKIRQVGTDWQVRLTLGRDAGTDEEALSPWLPVQPVSAGGLKVKVKPTLGERFGMLSPSGTVGSGSWAVRGPFDQDHPAPTGDEDVVLERGQSRLTIEDGRILITNGKTRVELDGDTVRIDGETIRAQGKTIALSADSLTHNGGNISRDHRHTGVENGLGISGPPV